MRKGPGGCIFFVVVVRNLPNQQVYLCGDDGGRVSVVSSGCCFPFGVSYVYPTSFLIAV